MDVKVGDLVEVYRHVPRHEAGAIQVGKIGVGVVVEIKKHTRQFPETAPDTTVCFLNEDGSLITEWVGKAQLSGIVVTMKVLNDNEND